MKQHNELKKVQLFSKHVTYRQNLISCMVAMVTRIKYFEMTMLSYIVMSPYFNFMIFKIMVATPNIFESLNSLGQNFVLFSFFIFTSKLSYFPLLSMLKISKNDVTFETTPSLPQS